MKRLCFLVDSIFSVGGVQRVTAVISRQLAAEGYGVTIMTFDPPERKDTRLYDLDQAGVDFRFVSYPSVGWLRRKVCKAYSAAYLKLQPQSEWLSRLYGRSSFPAPLRRMLARELNAGHYDTIVGVHAPLAARLATLKPQLHGARCVGWVHNSFEALFGPTSLYIGERRKRHYTYQFLRLDTLVTLCHEDARQYTAYDGRLHPQVIYNPLTLQPGAPSDGTSRRFLTVGRFTPLHKGIDLLIEAFSLLARHDSQWRLDIVGEGPEEPHYREAISRHGLQERIAIHPFTRHIQDFYSRAQVYVLSSRWEGMPLVLVEAMAHGLPVVTSDLPVCKEILGEQGHFFAAGDAAALARSLEAATRMDWPLESALALATASRFDVQTITNQWKQIL